tara:strand:+ start:284 stop:580 length:297 start_codon:yes stop_codon:yes gene_type:complete
MKAIDSTIVEVKDEDVTISKEVKTNLTTLKEAIAHTLENGGYYHYSCEPSLDVTDYDDEVNVTFNRDSIDVDSMIDDQFIKSVVNNLEIIKAKENNNG